MESSGTSCGANGGLNTGVDDVDVCGARGDVRRQIECGGACCAGCSGVGCSGGNGDGSTRGDVGVDVGGKVAAAAGRAIGTCQSG